MFKIVVHLDLDNTLIYSKAKKQFDGGVCVEQIDGEDFSFMTEYSYKMLNKLNDSEDFEIVPITTRNVKQYQRLNLPKFKYALLENGGVLLIDDFKSQGWFYNSQVLANRSQSSLSKAYAIMEDDENRISDVRNIDNFFIYTKTTAEQEILTKLQELDDLVCTKNITKLYAIPKYLTKLEAVKRFRGIYDRNLTIAAGDNPNLDWCMCDDVDVFIKPIENTIYSDEIFRYIEEEFFLEK